ncbi:MAG: sugar fermentation stimulation protein SfsA, partial [Candidatus Thiodiazotropha taylori]|nr:sugar fermentation stimulation protein SfsA [Candidatus Thiodiazotropha taylori]MCW4233796.1 sugar fermentation stimulation protein SfsA [Candidatus Thiodiazotropha taylori]
MRLPPLTDGHIIKRYKRFLADVELAGGEVVTAHCPNTGSMSGCWEPGAPVQISHSDNPRRKLSWTLERV